MMRRLPVLEVFLIAIFLTSCVTPGSVNLMRYEYQQPQMGVPFRMVLYAPDQPSARAAAEAAFARIRQLNDIMSDYEPDSELSRLARTSGQGCAVRLSPDLWRVLNHAQNLSARTGGAFDVTVGPLVNLWRKARRDRQMPDPIRLARALEAVGYQHIKLDAPHHAVLLEVPNMRLDLGAIAKGYATDQALKVLRKRGIERALVAGAGDMAAGDAPPGRPGWRIELAPPDVTNAPAARYVLLRRMALATSGDAFQHVEIDGQRYSHIVNPRTGIGLIDHSLVTVIAKDCMTADSLATAVSVLGPTAGLDLVENTRCTAARIIRKLGDTVEQIESAGFGRFYE
jgi:thiamine biosynthesis lipoprotein